MKLLDCNIIIYSASKDYSYLRTLVRDPQNFASAISLIEVLGYHKLTQKDKTYFEACFSILKIIDIDREIIH